jgi:hypothetical protein
MFIYFTGRFNKDVFIVAPGTGPAPTPHGVKDDGTNPVFDPIHTCHIGLWFATATRADEHRISTQAAAAKAAKWRKTGS